MLRKLIVLMVVGVAVSPARADVKPAAIFGDHMILQRDKPVPVWGKAAAGETVSVSFNGQTKTVDADKEGNWLLKLDPLKAGGPFDLTIAGKSSKVAIKDVLVGEVWLCSGQSNMAMSLKGAEQAAKDIPAAELPKIRYSRGAGAWQVCDPKTAGGFSATAFYFGRALHKELDVPIGLINRSVGGTSARLWTSQDAIAANPELKELASTPKVGNLYETFIRPLVPFAIRGVIWYQGEADAGRSDEYRKLFPTMIRAWRKDFDQGDVPFLFVQLANIGAPPKTPQQEGWGPIRAAQASALALPRTGMAVIIDGDADLHPKKKHLAGERLALAARGIAYGEKLTYSGPLVDSAKADGNKAILGFKHIGGGLVIKGDKPVGFAIAGTDKKFVWADAKVEGDKIVVSSSEVPTPAFVRYGWSSNPQCNLYNKEGLPASPFEVEVGK
ncbi:MAG: sialate O-acetylesterase [Gemmataceae bacterium]